MSVLEMREATMRFGGVIAVESLNLEVNLGEIVAIIGPNGAGKTTAFNMITGVYAPTSGLILFDRDGSKEMQTITGMRPDLITKLGVARTFQNIKLFQEMTVLDNVLISSHIGVKSDVFSAIFGLPHYLKEEKAMRERSMELLDKVDLADEAAELATSLPYGKQRKLEIARALATKPRLLLLDEPAAGMNPTETQELTDFVYKIRDEFDLTILLIEHHMQIVMDISDRIYVLDFGKLIAQGVPEEIKNNERVIDAYLGVADD
ncbi:MAG: ABC transporter ATP-binding protein [Eubacteriaceae bacterium]|nr:ABC transporter ATP-binding protein [Eubacteriaceae bacterium]